MAAATDCDRPIPMHCSPLEKYNYIKTINDAVVTVRTCPTKYFPFVLFVIAVPIEKPGWKFTKLLKTNL